MSKIAVTAKEAIYKYCIFELKKLIKDIEDLLVPADYPKRTTYISVTEGAYSDETERRDMSFLQNGAKSSNI
jgi:hypothetical protein